MLEPYRAEIEGWLDAKPAMTAVDVLIRLSECHSDLFKTSHLRTMQRLVKIWWADQAARIVRHGMETLTPVPSAGVALPLAQDPHTGLGSIFG